MSTSLFALLFSDIPETATATTRRASDVRSENGNHSAEATTRRRSARDSHEGRSHKSAYSGDSQFSKYTIFSQPLISVSFWAKTKKKSRVSSRQIAGREMQRFGSGGDSNHADAGGDRGVGIRAEGHRSRRDTGRRESGRGRVETSAVAHPSVVAQRQIDFAKIAEKDPA